MSDLIVIAYKGENTANTALQHFVDPGILRSALEHPCVSLPLRSD